MFQEKCRIFGLIPLEFGVEDGRIGVMQPRVMGRQAENKPKLLDQVRNAIRIKHYSIRTEQAYVDWRVKPSATR